MRRATVDRRAAVVSAGRPVARGAPGEQVGGVLGMTRPAVQQRFGRAAATDAAEADAAEANAAEADAAEADADTAKPTRPARDLSR